MTDLPITSVTAALLALIYIVLTVRVGMARGKAGASLGDGSGATVARGQEHTVPLLVASRSHANFAEFVPLALILLALAEHAGATHALLLGVAIALVAGRIAHPLGMRGGTLHAMRGLGAALTALAIATTAIELLLLYVL
jgi:uncharacterized membrane protein YecN with MAPEG domain